MSWCRDEDRKIITDKEFDETCSECNSYCCEGRTSIPCKGVKEDCPNCTKVDTIEYDREIRDKVIDEFAEALNNKISEFVLQHKDNLEYASGISVAWNIIDEIAEQMKEVRE